MDRPTALPKWTAGSLPGLEDHHAVKAPFCKAYPFAPAKQLHDNRSHNHPTKTKNTKNEPLQCTVQSGLKKHWNLKLNWKQTTGTWVSHEQIGIHKLHCSRAKIVLRNGRIKSLSLSLSLCLSLSLSLHSPLREFSILLKVRQGQLAVQRPSSVARCVISARWERPHPFSERG